MSESIGDKPVYARPYSMDDFHEVVCHDQYGMTYRQWLIGMALANLAGDFANQHQRCASGVSKIAVCYADAIIAQLDAEEKQ